MNYYLVDYQNVNKAGLDGVSRLGEDDMVCIFYTDNSDTLSFGLHKRLNESQATIIFRKVLEGTKNALDFQLASFLGYIICENEAKPYHYYIVSKDKGFECIVNYWKKKADIKLVVNVVKENEEAMEPEQAEETEQETKDEQAKEPEQTKKGEQPKEADQAKKAEQPKEAEQSKKTEQTETAKLVQSVCQLSDPGDADTVAKIIQKYKTKTGIHTALMKVFPSKDNHRASQIYTAIKPLIADKKGR